MLSLSATLLVDTIVALDPTRSPISIGLSPEHSRLECYGGRNQFPRKGFFEVRRFNFKPNGVRLFVIKFQHYDDRVHSSTDTTYAVTKKNLTPLQVLHGFAKDQGVRLNEHTIESGHDFARATYTPMDRSYKIEVNEYPQFVNDSVVTF